MSVAARRSATFRERQGADCGQPAASRFDASRVLLRLRAVIGWSMTQPRGAWGLAIPAHVLKGQPWLQGCPWAGQSSLSTVSQAEAHSPRPPPILPPRCGGSITNGRLPLPPPAPSLSVSPINVPPNKCLTCLALSWCLLPGGSKCHLCPPCIWMRVLFLVF